MNGRTYGFDLVIQLAELHEDFLRGWMAQDNLNQPTILDYFEWISRVAHRLAEEASDGLDGNGAKAK